MIDRLKFFHDFLNSGAWPLLVGDVNCQVNSDNERDQEMINRLEQRRFEKDEMKIDIIYVQHLIV
jgi:hypothetical protein